MANDKTHSITLMASGLVKARRFVDKSGAHATNSAAAVGISEQGQDSNKPFSAVTGYAYEVDAAEAIAEGAFIKPSDDGSGRAAVGSVSDNVGYALAAAAAGGRVLCRFIERAGGAGGSSVVTISGILAVGQTLTAVAGPGWQFSSGQWYRDGSAINGATALTYTLQTADTGKIPAFVPNNPLYRASSGVVAGDPNVPTVLFVKQNIRVVDQTPIARLLHRSSPRNSVVIRNLAGTTINGVVLPSTVLQLGFTTNNNNNNNAPSSWFDVAVGDEFYEADVDHQIWIRAKNAGETVNAQIEVETPRI